MLKKLSSVVLAVGLLAVTAGPVLALPIAPMTHLTIAPSAPVTPSPLRGALGVLGAIGFVVGITIRADTATLASKFVTRAGAAAGDYKNGVAAAGNDWEARTKDAEPAYEQGVQASIARKSFGKGVSGSASKYQTNAANLGSTRYQPGVANAKDAWARGVQPALDTLKSLNLPPRGARRSPQNQARANAVATALGAMKENK